MARVVPCTSQVSPLALTQVPEGVFNFTVGQPSAALIPHAMLSDAISTVLRKNIDPLMFQYSPQLGPYPTRAKLARFLQQSHLHPTLSADEVGFTFGNSLGISCAIAALLEPGQTVLCEEFTYFLMSNILRDASLNIHACPLSVTSGLDISALERMVEKIRPRLVYLNPIHQNPTGSILPVKSRERLLQLSQEYDFFVFSDEPYLFLSFPEERISEELKSLSVTASRIFPDDAYKKLICFGSFSKIVAPGLRCGWITGHPEILHRISNAGALSSGGGPSCLITESLSSLIDSGGLDNHISFLRRELCDRATRMTAALIKCFGDQVSFGVPRGGYFMYVSFVSGIDTTQFVKFCSERGFKIIFLPGAKCSVNEIQLGPNSSLRLAFSFYTPNEIEAGIDVLKEAYDAFIS